jgi:ribosomal protein S12 methylthiotransferase
MTDPIRVSLISLGCPKNLVDSEVILGRAAQEGFLIAQDPREADVVVINTCGFLEESREESRRTIREVVQLKESGDVRGVVVAGCYPGRIGTDAVLKELPGVDAVVGISDYSGMPAILRKILDGSPRRYVARMKGGEKKSADTDQARLLLTPRSYAYLRIGEGCDHPCAFCSIPLIRGKHTSKPIDTLVGEARGLAQGGVKELVLVAEDSTDFGMDRDRRRRLHELLPALGEVEGIEWIRVLYAYPHTVSKELTTVLREHPKVVKYLDIPIQHIAGPMLKAMKRGVSHEQVRGILDRLRAEVPGIAVRTTVIVGFPGETEQDFAELLRFVEEYRFERLGAFPYSREPGTPSFDMPGQVPQEVMRERLDRIMAAQRAVIEARNARLVGTIQRVLVDGWAEGRSGSVGRTYADAPEIDCTVQLRARLRSGEFQDVKITGFDGFDLVGEPVAARTGSRP